MNRRSFFRGLFGSAVIAAAPKPLISFAIESPVAIDPVAAATFGSTFLTTQFVTAQALKVLHANLHSISCCSEVYDREFIHNFANRGIGESVFFKVPQRYAA